MSPRFSSNNAPNTVLAHAILFGQCCLRKARRPNLLDVSLGEFSKIMLFASFVVRAVTSFAHHIVHVFSMSAHREMGWIYARRIIARMHDFHTNGYPCVVCNHPGHARGNIHFSSVMDSELALSSNGLGCKPQPTIIGRRLLNFNPKTVFKSFVKHEGYVHFDESVFKLVV